ncbi:molybdopterin oxidoreductase family protein [Phenylobacterium montanum]|uniref:Nitrate reductase n=1 Tax=Phenylobacterium montanum TaxID=2823693 RepID=A0A975G276_9CAUL|nr:nitrate reductase [Caulobacter sp. S6]QUD89346.1 nitrate reductase [Caulobacter sp. S6]
MADGSGPSPIRTTCPYCGVGCGVSALPGSGRALAVAGDKAHPANYGRLCSKGTALGATVGLEGRLLRPEIGGRPATWEAAIRRVAQAFNRTIERHGPDSVAFYVSGQLLTEDYYAANKLMKGFIGSANIDTNSRLCMASAVAAHKLAFGADLVPGCYEDLELADLIVFSGHNAAWTHPVLVRRMEQARARGQAWVVVDPRRTDTADMADLHLAIAPQSDVRLWNGLLAELIRRGVVDRAFVEAHVSGFDDLQKALEADDQGPAAVTQDCGIALKDLIRFYDLFARTERTVSLFSMGANQSAQGVAKGLSILNAHLVTGRIGKPGACPFSITGQPNAMGGRETGGLANTLAAHMDFDAEAVDRVARFWSAPNTAAKPGLKAVDMFEAVRDGHIKALWVMATNPAVSMPNSGRVREALARCPFVVVSDVMAETDTTAFAHVKLPALAWGEKDGTVTNSERRISRQRPAFPAPGEARADWRIIAEVATAMGHGEAFGWRNPAAVFREYARLTAFENTRRPLNLGPLIDLTPAEYDALAPVQWPPTPGGGDTPRLFADGRFATLDGKAKLNVVHPQGPASAADGAFPFSLNTGRVRDHWHTMTRTGLAADLCRHAPEPYVAIHPEDAVAFGVEEGALTRLRTAQGEAVAVARLTDRQRRGGLFMPMHWTDAFAPSGRSNGLIGQAVDPRSGQPEFKHTPARVSAYRETWLAFFIDRRIQSPPRQLDLIWRRTPQDACQLYEIAGRGDDRERARLIAALAPDSAGETLTFTDPGTGAFRRAVILKERLERLLFIAPAGLALPPRDWLASLFELERLGQEERMSLLAGRKIGAPMDTSPVVCACLKVRESAIVKAVTGGAVTVDAVAAATAAGTNCGSCRTQVAGLIARHAVPAGDDRDAA